MAGCEVGLYYREPCTRKEAFGLITIYDDAKGTGKWYRAVQDEDFIKVSYTFNAKNSKFEREAEHWWTTGFEWGAETSPTEPKMHITIEFKSEEMMKAFLNGGEIPKSVSSSENELLEDQTWGFLNAVKKSRDSSAIKDNLVIVGNSITFIYDNAIINKQPQDPNQVETILNTNKQFLNVYEKVKEYAGIPFEKDDIRYINDPNYMTIDMWKNAFVETGYLKCAEYKAWKNQFYATEGKLWELDKKSPAFRLAWGLAGGSTSLSYSIESMKCLIEVLNIKLEYLGIDVEAKDLIEMAVNLDSGLDTLVEYGKTVANTVYRNDNGEKGYIYEWYPRWYAQYERTINSNITIWRFDSEEGKPNVKYGDYIYAMNHLPGMTYSLLYIYKCIENIHP